MSTIYVDALSGNDSGNGSESHPYKTFDYAYNRSVSGDIIVLKSGTYVWTNTNFSSKHLTIKGGGINTVFIFNTPFNRYSIPGGAGNGYFRFNSNVTFEDLILETRGSGTDANYFYIYGGIAIFERVVFRNLFDLSYTDFVNYGTTKFINCVFADRKNWTVRQNVNNSNTLVFENCYGDIIIDPYSDYLNEVTVINTVITPDPKLSPEYMILESVGLGIGIYGIGTPSIPFLWQITFKFKVSSFRARIIDILRGVLSYDPIEIKGELMDGYDTLQLVAPVRTRNGFILPSLIFGKLQYFSDIVPDDMFDTIIQIDDWQGHEGAAYEYKAGMLTERVEISDVVEDPFDSAMQIDDRRYRLGVIMHSVAGVYKEQLYITDGICDCEFDDSFILDDRQNQQGIALPSLKAGEYSRYTTLIMWWM